MRRFLLLTVFLIIAPLMLFQTGVAAQGDAILVGHITFNGEIPPPHVIEVNRDWEFCGDTVTIQPLIVDRSSHGVQNAVVSVEGMQAQRIGKNNPPPDLTITNRHCAFIPRISATRLGAALDIRSEDLVLHNTQLRLGRRTILNVAMVPEGQTIRKKVKNHGKFLVKCAAHEFMRAVLFVFDHPFFQVTNEVGEFQWRNSSSSCY